MELNVKCYVCKISNEGRGIQNNIIIIYLKEIVGVIVVYTIKKARLSSR